MYNTIWLGFWKHQKKIATIYLLVLVIVASTPVFYYFVVPDSFDTGLAVVLRAIAYKNSFDDIKEAKSEIASGRTSEAEARLLRFIEKNSDIQPAQLMTHAFTEASILLANIYRKQGKLNKATLVMAQCIQICPLNYYVWYSAGIMQRARGNSDKAIEYLHEAFKLAPGNPVVVAEYLALLGEEGKSEKVMWVFDHYERARIRGAPFVQVKVGVARSPLQRQVLEFANIVVGHGFFTRTHNIYGLARGSGRSFRIPLEMFDSWPVRNDVIYIQLEFHNIYQGLTVEGLSITDSSGVVEGIDFTQEQMAYLHQPNSGGSYYAEFDIELDLKNRESLAVNYSCSEHNLAKSSLRIIEKARLNRRVGDL